MTNRHDRRIAQAKQRRIRREVTQPGYNPAKDPDFLKGIAITVRAVEFGGLKTIGGLCMLRALVGLQALHNCHIDASLHIGSMLCRIGSDDHRDVVAFCGPGNAGYGSGYHAWIEVGGDIIDLSVGDWRGLDPVAMERAMGMTPGEPPQWTVTLPSYWSKPRRTFVDPWRPVGTPALGEAWYGPYDDDPFVMHKRIRDLIDDIGAQIGDAVETVVARAAARQGLPRPDKNPQPIMVNPIIESRRTAPDVGPPGMMEVKLSEIFRLAGLGLGDRPDAVAYVHQRPRTPEQAREMLANMAIMAGR